MGVPLGAYNMFNLFGTTGTFTYVIIYGLGNVAAWRYFRTAGRDESSVIKYVAVPHRGHCRASVHRLQVLHTASCGTSGLRPGDRRRYVAAGAACLVWALRPGRRDWMTHAGVMEDSHRSSGQLTAAGDGSASLPDRGARPGRRLTAQRSREESTE